MPSGLHGLGVHVLLWGGALLLAWALLADWVRQRMPSRRKRRCPKCWYDLSHTPGLRCSECGYEARRERRLFKAKRRWWLATLAMLLLIGSYALHVTPEVEDRGWVAAVPTTVLIVGLPWLDHGPAPQATSKARHAQRLLFVDLTRRRMVDGGMPQWQRRTLLRRAAATTTWIPERRPPMPERTNASGILIEWVLWLSPQGLMFLDVDELDRLVAGARTRLASELIVVPSEHIRGTPLEITVRRSPLYTMPDHKRMFIRPLFDGAVTAELVPLEELKRTMHLRFPMPDQVSVIGTPPFDATKIEFVIELWNSEPVPLFGRPGTAPDPVKRELVWSTRITKPIRIVDVHNADSQVDKTSASSAPPR